LPCPDEPEEALRTFAMTRIVTEEKDGVNEWKRDCQENKRVTSQWHEVKKGYRNDAVFTETVRKLPDRGQAQPERWSASTAYAINLWLNSG
jgi:hypothetical protein